MSKDDENVLVSLLAVGGVDKGFFDFCTPSRPSNEISLRTFHRRAKQSRPIV